MYLLVIYTPVTHAEAVRTALAEADAGKIGNYDSCSFAQNGTGRFRPLQGATPQIGTENIVEEVEEERLEVCIANECLEASLEAIRTIHPYEQPALYYWEVQS